MAIPIILKGDTPKPIPLALADGYDYTGCCLHVEFCGLQDTFIYLAAGGQLELRYTAEQTAALPLGTSKVMLSLENANGEVRFMPWAKIKVTDSPADLYDATITIDPATLDVDDLTAKDSLGAVKTKLQAVIDFLRGLACVAVCLSMLPMLAAYADVAPLYTTPNDMPGDAPLMTNVVEYVEAHTPVVDFSTNNTELVETIGTLAIDAATASNIVAGATNSIPRTTRTSQLVNDGDGTNPFATVADVASVPVYGDQPDFSDWEVFPVSDSYEPVGYPEYWNGEWLMYVYYPAWYGDYEAYGNTTDPNALYVEFVCDDIAPGLVVCTAKRSRIDIKGWTIGGNTNAVMQPAGDYAARAELQRVETNVVPRAARDATNYVDRATALIPVWEDAPPGTVDPVYHMPVISWFRGYELNFQRGKAMASTNWVAEVARSAATNAAKIAAMPGVVTNIVRDLSLGGIWDSQLEVWWTPRMRNGSLTYEATTNVNLNAEN